MSLRSARPALVHPVFVVALVALVINDHSLKGSGLVPGWLTGKLSDFAGLVVAPVVLAVLVRARSKHALLLVHGAIAIGFALTEVSQPAADLVAGALSAVGVPWVLRADLGDLSALVILPLPFALLSAPVEPVVSRAAPRVSFGLAMLACLGSPTPPPAQPMWFTSAYLVNRASTERNVRLSWVDAALDCESLARPDGPGLSRAIDPGVLGGAVTFRLQPGESVPIEEVTARAAVGTTVTGGDAGRPDASGPRDAGTSSIAGSRCQVVLLRSDGFPDTLVLLDLVPAFAVPSSLDGQPSTAPERAVELVAAPDLAWNVGAALPSATLAVHPEPTTCVTERENIGTGYDGRSSSRRIAAVDVGVDGCLRVVLELTVSLELSDLFLCGVPREMFPFDVGDAVIGRTTGDGLEVVADDVPSGRAFAVHRGGGSVSDGDLALTISEPEACNGLLLPCGGFVQPSGVMLVPAILGEDLSGIVTRTDSLGRRVRILAGRAETVLVARSTCDPERASPGPHVSMVVAYDRP